MDIKTYKKIYSEYPEFFPKRNIIDCNIGWYQIISELCGAIKIYYDGESISKDIEPIIFESIKERFGVLEISYSGGDKIVDHIIQYSKRLSYKTCEICGTVGQLYCSTKWMSWSNKKTLCNDHAIQLYYYTLT